MNIISDLFIKYGKKHIYKNNDVIFNEEDFCEKVGFIESGSIKISTFTSLENEVVINLLKKDECFGHLLIFSSNPYYYGMATALEKTTIYYLKKNELFDLFKNDSIFLNEFLKLISNHGVLLKQKNKLLAHKNIEERITFYLYNIAKKKHSDTIYFKSVTEMANILSIPRPSLSRVLHQMKNDGKILIEKHTIKLLN